MKEMPVWVLAMVIPPVVMLNAKAMLNAARVSVGIDRRARKALVMECEIWISSVMKINGRKKRMIVFNVRCSRISRRIPIRFRYEGSR